MRLAAWPRMPYLNDELREWIAAHLATLGVDEIAVYAVDPQRGQDEERRILVATEIGLIDGWYAPRGGSSARYGFTARLWPWQAVRGVDLRGETYRVWALEHRTRWWLRIARPAFESETDQPELGAALCDLAKVCAVMAEPAGWQAAQEDVLIRREGLRALPAPTDVPAEAGTDVEAVTPTGRPAVPPPMVLLTMPPSEVAATADAAAGSAESPVATPPPAPSVPGVDPPEQPTSGPAAPAPAAPASAAAAAEAEPDEAEPDVLPEEFVAEEEIEDRAHGRAPEADTSPERSAAQPVGEPVPMAVDAGADHDEASTGPLGALTRLGGLTGRRESRRERDHAEGNGTAAIAPAADAPASLANVPEAAAATRTADTIQPGEEAIDLGAYLPGEEPINLDDYDPDPLGLRGPLIP